MLINVNGILRANIISGGGAGARIKRTQAISNVDKLQRITEGKEPLNICVIRTLGGIGDVLMSTPLLRALKHQFPNSELTYATDFKYMGGALKDLLQHNPHIDKLIPYQIALGQDYDFITDITTVAVGVENNNPRDCSNRIDLFAEHAGVDLRETGYLPVYIITNEEVQWAKDKLAQYPLRTSNCRRIGIQVRSSTSSRSLPIEKVRELAIMLAQHSYIQVFLFDSSHGNGPEENWNIAGLVPFKDYGIRQVAALVNEMDLMICPDSGLLHIAGALGKKIVSLWAGTNYKARINYYPNAIAIASEHLQCYPCFYAAAACSKKYTCLDNLVVKEIHDTTIKHLKADLAVQKINNVVKSVPTKKTKARILVHRSAGLGDTVMMTSPVRALRKKYPDAFICVSTYRTEVFDRCDYVDKVEKVDWDRSPRRQLVDQFDKVYDLDYCVESGLVCGNKGKINEEDYLIVPRMNLFYRALNLGNVPIEPTLIKVSLEEKEKVKHLLDENKKNILYVANSSSPLRTYFAEGATVLIENLARQYNVIVSGDFREIWGEKKHFTQIFNKIIETYNLKTAFKIETMDLISLIASVDLVISPDSGPMHVAEAVGTKCVGIFANIQPYLRCSSYKYIVPIISNLGCISECCDRPSIQSKLCKIKDGIIGAPCVRAIKPEAIFSLIGKNLG